MASLYLFVAYSLQVGHETVKLSAPFASSIVWTAFGSMESSKQRSFLKIRLSSLFNNYFFDGSKTLTQFGWQECYDESRGLCFRFGFLPWRGRGSNTAKWWLLFHWIGAGKENTASLGEWHGAWLDGNARSYSGRTHFAGKIQSDFVVSELTGLKSA